MQNEIKKYIRKEIKTRKGKRRYDIVGVLLAKEIDDVVYVSAAVANLKAGDKFSKQRGLEIAHSRIDAAAGGKKYVLPPSSSIHDDLEYFIGRAKRYFQKDKVVIAFGNPVPKVAVEVRRIDNNSKVQFFSSFFGQ